MNLETLKKELTNNEVSVVVNKYILGGNPICFSGREILISQLKKALAEHFNVHIKNIEIVGSGKLGISLNRDRFGKQFDAHSNIDIAVVSSELFDIAWFELMKLESITYKLTEIDRGFLKECSDSISKGFISPDKLPQISNFSQNWWKIFLELSNKDEYECKKIRGRLFKDWWFAEKYYSLQLTRLKSEIGGK